VLVVPQQLLRQRRLQLLAAVEETVVRPPQEPQHEVVWVDQLRRRLQLGLSQPVAAAETVATAQPASAAMAEMVAQP
jgi:hypothetical protein